MKKTKLKVFIVMLFIMISVTQVISMAASKEILTIKEDENNYLIYLKDVLNEKFQFAFSNTKEEADLNYINSAKDTQGKNIAYIDETLKSKFFTDNNAYIWVKTNAGESILKGEKIDLTKAETYAKLEKINGMTKTITINANAESEKIKINGNSEQAYYYKMVSIGSSEEYQRFVELVEKISKQDSKTDIYTKIESYVELNELYNRLVSEINDNSWTEAQNQEIEKPYDAQEKQQYVLWLKDSQGTIDFQILTAYQRTIKTIELKEKTVEVTSKLPVTYDNTSTLYIALAVVLVAIIVMVVIRTKISKKENRK